MESLLDNAHFISDYQKLMEVSLNPSRHTAPNGFEHCELVRTRVGKLAKLNNCSDEESLLLKDLARLHDIGKITGSSKPSDSVELLKKYHIKNHQIGSVHRKALPC